MPEKRKKLEPLRLQSCFGTQVDSRRASPASIVFGTIPKPPSRRPIGGGIPPPTQYLLIPACGPQPLSPYYTAERVSLKMKEDRWLPMERVLRLNATPAPSAYNPKY